MESTQKSAHDAGVKEDIIVANTAISQQEPKPSEANEFSLQQLSTLAAQAIFSSIDHAVKYMRTTDEANPSAQAKFLM